MACILQVDQQQSRVSDSHARWNCKVGMAAAEAGAPASALHDQPSLHGREA